PTEPPAHRPPAALDGVTVVDDPLDAEEDEHSEGDRDPDLGARVRSRRGSGWPAARCGGPGRAGAGAGSELLERLDGARSDRRFAHVEEVDREGDPAGRVAAGGSARPGA